MKNPLINMKSEVRARAGAETKSFGSTTPVVGKVTVINYSVR
jgi:hypothetical protein